MFSILASWEPVAGEIIQLLEIGRTAGRDEAHLGGGLHVFEEQLDELSTLFLCASVQRQTSETSSPAVCPLIALVPHSVTRSTENIDILRV